MFVVIQVLILLAVSYPIAWLATWVDERRVDRSGS